MKPLRSVQQQVSPLGRSVNWAGHRRAAVGRWGSRGGGGCTITPDSTRIRHLKHNTISYWDNPPPLCKSSILHIHFFLGNAINSRYRCMLFLLFFFFSHHNSANLRPYVKLLHKMSLPTSSHSHQGGGSPSVLLTLYKAGGTCFPRLDFFCHVFFFFIFNFNIKKSLISVKILWSLKNISFIQREGSFLLSFILVLVFLSRVTLLCLFKN